MKRWIPLCLLLLIAILSIFSTIYAQDTSAEAINYANLRAEPGTDAPEVGQIQSGSRYVVLGRSARFPWLLLGDPTTQQPVGWVYETLVTVTGNINNVPFSELVVTTGQIIASPTVIPSTPIPGQATTTPTASASAPVQPTATATVFQATTGVTGSVRGEVNIRYGPDVTYDRVGVAQAGDTFEVLAYHTQVPWLKIRYENSPNGEAWIAQSLLDITGDIYTLDRISTTNLLLPTLTPTPSVLSASSLRGEEAPLSAEFTALGNRLWNKVLEAGFDPQTNRFGALFLLDLQTGEALTFGDGVAFSGTSINKISILARLYAELEIPPTETLATDIANTMICSENAATNRLLAAIGGGDEFLGADEVTRMLNELGLTNSYIVAPYTLDPNNPPEVTRPVQIPETSADQVKAFPDATNQLTVSEIGWLLGSIYQCGYENSGPLLEMYGGQYEPRECRQMLHVMSNNNVDGLLKTGVPEGIRVAHKHGWIADTHSNAAVFFTPGGDYVLSLFLHQPEWLNFEESLPLMSEVSREVYNYYNRDAPQLEIREGFIPDAPTCNFAGTPLISDLRQAVWEQ